MSYFKDGYHKTKPRETKCIGKVEEKLEHLCNGGGKETWCSHSKQCEAFSVIFSVNLSNEPASLLLGIYL